MSSVNTTIFKNNQSQAVRLPKAVSISEDIKEVVITAVGNARIITPANQSWDDWFDAKGVSDDFMENRQQENDQARDRL
jgi:antitoxin VapB